MSPEPSIQKIQATQWKNKWSWVCNLWQKTKGGLGLVEMYMKSSVTALESFIEKVARRELKIHYVNYTFRFFFVLIQFYQQSFKYK